jgi:hypothetical protein
MQAEDKPGLDKRSPEVDFNHVLLSKRNEYYMPNSERFDTTGGCIQHYITATTLVALLATLVGLMQADKPGLDLKEPRG